MLTTSDKAFKSTLAIKRNQSTIESEYCEFKEWIDCKYKVNVLNICFDYIYPSGTKIPRLDIVVDSNEELSVFKNKDGNFDSAVIDFILKEFKSYVNENNLSLNIENLLIVLSAFKPVGKSYVNTQINKFELDRLITEIDNPTLWKIQNYFGRTTIFLYTDQQIKTEKNKEWIGKLKTEYIDLIKKYDELDCFDISEIVVELDSKENFDVNYSSSWFMYYG